MTEVKTTIQQENQDSLRYEYNTTVEGRRVQSNCDVRLPFDYINKFSLANFEKYRNCILLS